MSALTEARDHALNQAAASSTGATDAAEWLGIANTLGAFDRMNDEAPKDWWPYVGCSYCNAWRQEPCQAMDGPSRGPHAARRAAARVLHGTLWLLANHPEDVLGKEDS